jgi:hemerythrin-like domain-containing protein
VTLFDITAASAPSTAVAPAPAPRFDAYDPIHRALRLFMTDTLGRVGWLDPADADERQATLLQVRSLLSICRSHLEHENRHVHPALESRRPGTTTRIADEHREHEEHLAALQSDVERLERQPDAAGAQRLYRHLALFVADNFRHMHYEETAHNQALWEAFSDDELRDIEAGIVASIPPEEMALVLRWLAPALPPAMRAAFFGPMQQGMPPEAFRAVLDLIRPTLNDTAWAKLARALNVPPVPGLVGV